MGPGPAGLVCLTDELGLHPQGLGHAIFVRLDAHGGGQGHDLRPLGHGTGDLVG